MMIQIRYVGKSNILGLEKGTMLRVEEGSTISDVLDTLKVDKAFHDFVVPLVNGEHQSIAHILQADDELDFFLPVSGG
jgi:molybdopterin converting factor small subunit